jgi:histidinol-phosphate aminotransferase
MSSVSNLTVPAVARLPSNAAYLGHLDVADVDPRLLRLTSNESTEPPSPAVRRAICRAASRGHLYPPLPHALRRRVGELHGVDPAGVLVGAGATEVIEAVFRCFVAPGDEVVLSAPTWPVYRRRLDAIGARLVEVPARRAGMAFSSDVDRMAAAATDRTKLLVACSPNNPTGDVLPSGALERLARAAPVVLVDHAYVDFADPAHAVEAIALTRRRENVVVTRTFSKAHALAGLRVGYGVCAAATADLVDRVALPGWSVSGPAIAAALAALDDPAAAARCVDEVRDARERLLASLRAAGLDAYDSQANFVAVSAAPAAGGAAALAEAFRAHGVLIRVMDAGLARITVPRGRAAGRLLAAVPAVAASLPRSGGPARAPRTDR